MRISILAYTGCMGSEVFGVCDTLLIANRTAAAQGGGVPAFEPSVISLGGSAVAAAGGINIGARRPQRHPALLVVPGFDFSVMQASHAPLVRLAPEISYIRRTFAAGVPVASICVGAFLLGEAGLLDDRDATTAWLFASDLARRFPAANVKPAALLVEDGAVTTTGAFTAAFDLAMHLVRRHAGDSVARATARIALLESSRESQAPFIDASLLERAQSGFASGVRVWLERRFNQPYDLNKLARAFHVSPRTLLRRFSAETGESPLSYLQGTRVRRAQQLLESSKLSVAQVTERTGYLDVSTFCGLFRRHVGQSPAAYRRRFQSN